ncbi:citrate synthase [Roseibium sp.]|uniref:citrate synthase n=3 Tax=Roseibium sp. TaxID=1936156 RepID=UPI0032678462
MTTALKHTELTPANAPGLEGIIVANTILSDVDGTKGELLLRGKSIEALAGHLSFEGAIAHLWQDLVSLPSDDLPRAFGAARVRAFAGVAAMQAAPAGLTVFERMRVGLSALSLPETQIPDVVAISGAMPVLLAAAQRIKEGLPPIAPDSSLLTAEDLLRMLMGATASVHAIEAVDRYLVTILDHGLNASTFTARVIASTQADMRDAVIGAMGALKGPLHGGAPGPVLDMLDAVGQPENAASWVDQELSSGKRLMGFGHRVYRTRDPRADVLKAGLRKLPQDNPKLVLAEAVEIAALAALAKAKPDRALDTNVEFYTAVLLDAVGIDRSLFTPLFAVGRTPGWCAHILEQQATGKLIRPASRYVGPKPSS